MLSEPRTYRYSILRLLLLIVLLVLLGVVPFVIIGEIHILVALSTFAVIGFIILISIYSLTRATTISDDSISTRTIFGESSLKWSEVESVSGNGNKIRLHNRDHDVTVAPSPFLPGYPEVIEMIGMKRPDLFSPAKYSSMSRNWFSSLLFLVIGGIFLAGAWSMYSESTDELVPLLILAFVALMLFVSIFLSVLSLRFDGSQLTVRYLLGQTVLAPEDVHSVVLNVTQTRNGKSYSVVMFTKRGRTIRFSGMGPSLPEVYLVLKNWRQGTIH